MLDERSGRSVELGRTLSLALRLKKRKKGTIQTQSVKKEVMSMNVN